MSKRDFPIFAENPGMIYLDSAATAQKPWFVLAWITDYLSRDYANVHRGEYPLSFRSEDRFWAWREAVAAWMDVDPAEVVFTGSGTDASNKLVSALFFSSMIQPWDRLMVSMVEHHANIVPWQIFAERYGCEIVWIPVSSDWAVDLHWLQEHYDHRVRVVAISAASNVTGVLTDIPAVHALLHEQTYLVVDASQAIVHSPVLPNQWGADFCWWTGHKIGALTGIGVLRWKKAHLERLQPMRWWWWAIMTVWVDGYMLQASPDKFEPWTPNLVWVVSLDLALQYLRTWSRAHWEDGTVAWFYRALHAYESPLFSYIFEQCALLEDAGVVLLGSREYSKKIWVFSMRIPSLVDRGFGAYCGARNIAIRCWWLCAQPFHDQHGLTQWTCRISTWLYTDIDELEKFFAVVQEFLWRNP